METANSFGYWLRRQRKARDLTQQALADRVGCSLAAIKKIEQDERRPSQQIAELLADILGVPASQHQVFLEVARGLRPIEQLSLAQEPVIAARPTGLVTFLFTNIEESTKRAQEYPAEWEKFRTRHHAILREAIQAHHGYVFQIVGDAFCAAFDIPNDALQAAIASQRRLQTENWGKVPLKVRMGLHTGEAEFQGDEYHGYLTISLVRRLVSAGHGGQILLSHATENLLGGHLPKDVRLLDLGRHKFKDIQQPIGVFQVLGPDLQKEFPALRARDFSPNNLPLQLTSFIGREKEIADVIRLLEKARLVTLTGPGGTGKTRLAIQVANQLLNKYSDGVWLVELAPLSDPTLLPQVIVNTIGLIEQSSRPCMKVLIDFLKSKQALLILDNCEHLIQACAEIADGLLHTCPQIRILTSSREPFGIAGETIYLVPSLTRPDIRNLPGLESLKQYEAIQLFMDRATSAISTFTLTEENASSIAQISQHLDGIPLAIELAASKIRALSASQIAQRLDDRFHLLTSGSRTALPRHQTLHAAIEWSYDLLSDDERKLFRQLSVFAGGWTFEAAAAICSDLDMLSLLTQLVNKSLVIVDEREDGTRYRLLETMRQYAHEKLFASDEAQQIRDRHLAFYLHFAEDAEPRLRSHEQVVWLERVETEYDNLRAALDWSLESGNSDHALRLGGALGYFWEFRGDAREGCKWLDEALALAKREQSGTVTAAQYARALYVNGRLHFLTFFDPTKGRTRIEESLRISREIGDLWQMVIALEHLGWVAILEGDIQTARTRLEEGILLARELQDRWPLALCLLRLASPLMRTDSPLAQQSAEEGVMLARSLGDLYLLMYGLTQLASAYFINGNYADAVTAFEEVLLKAPLIGGGYTDLSLFFLVVLTLLLGDPARAKSYCFQLLAHVRETGFAVGTALIALGWLASYDGQPKLSAHLLSLAEVAFHQSSMNLDSYGGPILMIYKQALEKAQAQLDPAAFQAAWDEGQRMTIERALAFATDSVLSN
jgi:predicted ATPase/class 3 adenylate cyclase